MEHCRPVASEDFSASAHATSQSAECESGSSPRQAIAAVGCPSPNYANAIAERVWHWAPIETLEHYQRLAERHGIPYLGVECRAVYADVQFSLGTWPEAEELARATIAMSEGDAPAHQSAGAAILARIRVAEGRLEEAERLMSRLEDSDGSRIRLVVVP